MFELFLSVYGLLADNSGEVLRYRTSKKDEDVWNSRFEGNSEHRIVENRDFHNDIERLLRQYVPTFPDNLGDPKRSVPLLVGFLRALEAPLAGYLTSHNKFTYPSPPGDGSTVVLRSLPYFLSVREEWGYKAPPLPPGYSASFADKLGLGRLYMVPKLQGDDLFFWDIYPFPEQLRNRLNRNASPKIGLLSFPHAWDDLRVVVDKDRRRFHVPGYGPNEAQIVDAVGAAISRARASRVMLLICPELIGSRTLRARLCEILADDESIIITCPGSEHEMVTDTRRNRCKVLGPGGKELESPPHHPYHQDKLTQFPLPLEALKRLGYLELADAVKVDRNDVLEDIDHGHRRIVLLDVPDLGRVAVLICLDILTPSVQYFLGRHQIDHVLVPAMSPSLERFVPECSKLGRALDAGIYVVNSCHWDQNQRRDATYVYLPYRGKQEGSRLFCESGPGKEHRVCLRILDIRKPEIVEISMT